MLSNTFAGIAPASVPGFIGAEIIGAALGWSLIRVLYPDITPVQAATAVVAHSGA
jgi:hypothetical protein